MTKKNFTVFFEDTVWLPFKERVRLKERKSGSQKLVEMMRAYLAEAEGAEPEDTVDYEALKDQHNKLVIEIDKIEKRLKKRHVYDDLRDFSQKTGLDLNTLDKLSDLKGVMLEKWHSVQEDIHQWITLLELVKEKREVEAKLLEIRSNSTP